MKKSIVLMLSAFILATAATVRSSEANAARRDVRQARQHARIHQGVQSDELTRGEAHRVRKNQRRINRLENRAENDGVVTATEKARLENAQDRASRQIYRLKHNDNQRGDGPGNGAGATAPASN